MDKTFTLFLVCYILAANVVAFAMYGLDKYYAKCGKWRISEKALLLAALLGGAFGAYAAMKTFRHKTKHLQFTIGVPVCMVINIAAVAYLLGK